MISLLIAQIGHNAIHRPFAQTADVASLGDHLFVFNVVSMTVFEFIAIVTQQLHWPLNYLQQPFSDVILPLNDASTLSTYYHSHFPVFQCFWEDA